MSLFKTLAAAAATGMLPALLSPVIGKDSADKIAPAIKNALDVVNKKNLNAENSSMKDLLNIVKETGMTKQQLMSSLDYLNNSKVGRALDYFSPNITSQLRGLGQEVYNSIGDNRSAPVSTAQTGGITSKYPSTRK